MNAHSVPGRYAVSAAVVGLLALMHPWSVAGQTFRAQQFEAELERYARQYADSAEAKGAQQLLISGDLDAYHRRLIERVPDPKKTFYDYFVLANLLYSEDPERSFEYMLEAEELQPDNPYVWLERGIHEHRLGNCETAIEYYRRLHDNEARFSNPVSWAYRTHCALRIGEHEEAIRAWRQADFSSHHTAIEKGMYVIFSESRPHTRRQQILTRIAGGEHAAFCELLQHDRNWELDWWNQTAQDEFLTYDAALAETTIAKGSDGESIVRLCLAAPTLSDEEFQAALTDAGLWGENASIPDSGTLIYDIALRLTSGGLADPAEVLNSLGTRMWQRFVAGNVDKPLLEVMGFLYSSTGDLARLREVDAYGWRELQLERFAASYLLGTDPNADIYGSLLEEASADFPNSAIINQMVLTSAGNTSARVETAANYVAAEFANVKENWKGPYRLSDLMASFEQEIDRTQL